MEQKSFGWTFTFIVILPFLSLSLSLSVSIYITPQTTLVYLLNSVLISSVQCSACA